MKISLFSIESLWRPFPAHADRRGILPDTQPTVSPVLIQFEVEEAESLNRGDLAQVPIGPGIRDRGAVVVFAAVSAKEERLVRREKDIRHHVLKHFEVVPLPALTRQLIRHFKP